MMIPGIHPCVQEIIPETIHTSQANLNIHPHKQENNTMQPTITTPTTQQTINQSNNQRILATIATYRRPHHPPRAMIPPALIVVVAPSPNLPIAVDEPPQEAIGLLPLVVILRVRRQRRHRRVGVVVVVAPETPPLVKIAFHVHVHVGIVPRPRQVREMGPPRSIRQMGPSQPGVLPLVDPLSLGAVSRGAQFLVGQFGPRPGGSVGGGGEGEAVHLAEGVLRAGSSLGHAGGFAGEDFVLVGGRRRRGRESGRGRVRGGCGRPDGRGGDQKALNGFHGGWCAGSPSRGSWNARSWRSWSMRRLCAGGTSWSSWSCCPGGLVRIG